MARKDTMKALANRGVRDEVVALLLTQYNTLSDISAAGVDALVDLGIDSAEAAEIITKIGKRPSSSKAKKAVVEDVPVQPMEEVTNYYVYSDVENRLKAIAERLDVQLPMKIIVDIADRIKNVFIQNMRHEIRTPLNAIMGFAQLMSNDLTEEERNLYNGYILESNNQLLSTLDDIIDVSNMEVGTFNFQFEHADVDQLCQSQEEAIRELIPDGVCYSYQPLQEGLCLHTDRKRVSQVLFNLLSNACKNTTSGSITLSVAHYIANNSVQFIVTDTGVGVPADKAKKIFEHFEKLDHYSPGLGLGLYVCNLIAQALGGEIYLDTGYTQGARFVFTVPNQPAETETGDSENNIPS